MWPSSGLTPCMLLLHSEPYTPVLFPVLLCRRQHCWQFLAKTSPRALLGSAEGAKKQKMECFSSPFVTAAILLTEVAPGAQQHEFTSMKLNASYNSMQTLSTYPGHLHQGSSVWTSILALKVAISRCSGREHQKPFPVRGNTLFKKQELVTGCGLWYLRSINSPSEVIYSFGFHEALQSSSDGQVNKHYLLLGLRRCFMHCVPAVVKSKRWTLLAMVFVSLVYLFLS